MNTLRFEKFSKLDRREPVCFAVPCAKGELGDPADFRLLDGEQVIPCQVTVTGRWPDDSVRWLFVRAICSLPGNAAKEMRFAFTGNLPAAQPSVRVALHRNADGSLTVDTGPLTLVVPAHGLWPVTDVRLHGRALWDTDPFRGFRAVFGRVEHRSRDLEVRLCVEEPGPLCAVVRIDGVDRAGDDSLPGVRARLCFWAGMPWFTMQYSVTNRSRALGTAVEVRDWALDIEPAGQAPMMRASLACYGDWVRRSKLRPRSQRCAIPTCFTKPRGSTWKRS